MATATLLEVLRQHLETERVFYTSLRSIELAERHRVAEQHMENVESLFELLRRMYSPPPPPPLHRQPMTFTFPLRDPLGESEGVIESLNAFLNTTVPIIPSPQQIRTGIENVTPPPETNCAICQDTMTTQATRLRHCGHHFHSACIGQWFSVNHRCPVCRHDIRETSNALQRTPATTLTADDDETDNSRMHSDEE